MAAAASFFLTLGRFKANLTERERTDFQSATLNDLHVTIQGIQERQALERRLQGMQRLERFLEAMKEYDKVIRIFVNSSEILAFVWGPMRFLLQVASTFTEAFNALLSAYEQIGDDLPMLVQYRQFFKDHPQMSRMLTLMYEDILEFHRKAIRIFKQRMWKPLFNGLWRNFNPEFAVLMGNLHRHRTFIESQAKVDQLEEFIRLRQLAEAKLQRTTELETRRQYDAVYQWLTAADSESDQDSFTNARQACPATGQWLLDSDQFQSWFEPNCCTSPLLWLSGNAGIGKTVLASFVVQEARKLNGVTVAFFYFKDSDGQKNSFMAVVKGILSQLLRQDDTLLPYLYENASKSGSVTLSNVLLAKELLNTAVKNCGRLYVVLDGIDECDRENRRDIATEFQVLCESLPAEAAGTFRCLFISEDDEAARKDFATLEYLNITQADMREDIQLYANTWSRKIGEKYALSRERQKAIAGLITDRAEGIFLVARLMTRHLFEQASIERLDEELLPRKFTHGRTRLTEVYSKLVTGITEQERSTQRKDGLKLIRWLLCSRRPFKWRELQCAVSIDMETRNIEWDPPQPHVLDNEFCGSLVEVRSDETVHLIHHTVREYVEENLVGSGSDELRLAILCMDYLSLPGFQASLADSQIRDYASRGYYAFLNYAYAYWAYHLERSLPYQDDGDAMDQLSECVRVFIDLHWTQPMIRQPIPKSLMVRLQPLKDHTHFDKLALAVAVAEKQLDAYGKPSPSEEVLDLYQVFHKVRACLEDIASAGVPSDSPIYQYYGQNLFKCTHVNCIYFHSGFRSKQEQKDHINKHDRPFFCPFPSCPSTELGFSTSKEVKKHESESHGAVSLSDEEDEFERPAEKVSFICPYCDAKFTRKYNLSLHLRIHQTPNEKPFVCSVCGKGFARQGDRTRHLASLHSDNNRFVCGGTLKSGAEWGCGRTFNRADGLARHFKSHRGKVCMQPLLEEEARESQMDWESSNAGERDGSKRVGPRSQESSSSETVPPGSGREVSDSYPAALLAEYPALADVQLGSTPAEGNPGDSAS